jgi:thioredoxin 1
LAITAVTDSSFDANVLRADMPVLVVFWAVWSGPCRVLMPTLESVDVRMTGRMRIAKMDIDANTTTPDNYGVTAAPTLILFENGRVIQSLVGAVSSSQLIDWLEKAL